MDSNNYPQSDDVICGRGKQFIHHTGNVRFRIAILMYLDQYMEARSKFDKSKIVLDIVSQFRNVDCAFVKRFFHPIDCWLDIGDKMVREKVGHALRDAIAMKSSSEKLKSSFRRSEETTANQTSHDVSHRIKTMTIRHLMKLSLDELMKIELSWHRYHGFRPCTSPVSFSFKIEDSSIQKEGKTNTELFQKSLPVPALPAPMLPLREMSDPFDPIDLKDNNRVDAAWMSLQSFFLREGIMPKFTDFDVAENYQLDFQNPLISVALDLVS